MTEAQRNFTTEELKTQAGKELAVYKVANTSLYKVCFTSGGQVPSELLGMWTDPTMAQKSIKAYLAGKDRPPVVKKVAAPTSAPVFKAPNEVAKPVSKKKTAKKTTS